MNRRRMSLVLALAAVFALAALGWFVPLSRNSQAAPAPSNDAVFKGKLLAIITNKDTMIAFLLEKAQVQKIGDHLFLVGKGVADDENVTDTGWCKGRTVRIQMEHIVSITEFDNLKDFIKVSNRRAADRRGGGYTPATPAAAPAPAGVALSPPPPAVVPAPPGR